MKIHAIQAGRLMGNATTLRGERWTSIFRRRQRFPFPAYVYVIERPEGHIAIDTGMSASADKLLPPLRRHMPYPMIEDAQEEIGPQMDVRGLRPEDVRTVILTHMDFDHVGGVGWFPDADVLVHAPEVDASSTFLGRRRGQTHLLPDDFDPMTYEMDSEPYGPFPQSKTVDEDIDMRLVPLPGHSRGQVGAIVRSEGFAIFFTADHFLRQDWFVDGWRSGRVFGIDCPELLSETTERILQFIEEVPTLVLPAHDGDAPRRLADMETIDASMSDLRRSRSIEYLGPTPVT